MASLLFGTICCALLLFYAGCTFARGEIAISKLPETEIEVSRSPKFNAGLYHSILVILPDAYNAATVTTAGGEHGADDLKSRDAQPTDRSAVPHPTLTLSRSQDYDFIVNEAEHFLLQRGFNIISRDIIARIDEVESPRYGQKSYLAATSSTQKALLLGQRTNADAILVISHVGAWPAEMNFIFDNDRFVFQPRPKPQDAEGLWVSYHLWEITMEAKLVDIKTGEVVWMASGRHNSRSLFDTDWKGLLKIRGDDIYLVEENFRIEDFNTYNFLYRQVAVLEKSLLSTLK